MEANPLGGNGSLWICSFTIKLKKRMWNFRDNIYIYINVHLLYFKSHVP